MVCMNFFSGFEKSAKLRESTELQPHQKRVLEKLDKSPGILLFHGLGSGKTLSAIAGTQGMKTDVVVPAALRNNFDKEVKKHTKGYRPNIMSYEKYTRSGDPSGEALIIDEAHMMGDGSTKRTQGIVAKAPLYKRRIFLTGTPIKNKPHEIGAIMRGVRGDKSIPADETTFKERFIGTEKVSPGLLGWLKGVTKGNREYLKDPEGFRAMVSGHVDYYDPPKEGFPSVSHEVVQTEMSPEQINHYNFAMDKAGPILSYKIKKNLPPNKQESRQLNAFLQSARQVSNTPKAVGGPDDSPKFDEAVHRVREGNSKDPNFKALVYSNYISAGVNPYSDRLNDAGIPHAVFTGKLNDKERKKIVDDYNKGKVKALLISGAGAQGLDLKGTKLIQIMEPHWNDTKLEQATGRGIRYKSHNHLPEDERHVHVERHQSILPLSLLNKITFSDRDRSADEYLDNLSKDKQKLTDQFLDILKEEGV